MPQIVPRRDNPMSRQAKVSNAGCGIFLTTDLLGELPAALRDREGDR